MIVRFLNKEYDIPKDVLLYVDLLTVTENIKENLLKKFFTKIKYGIDCIEDKDFLEREIDVEAGRFIAKLCENNIYNKTVKDYLYGNKGYEFFHTANKEALNRVLSLRKARNAAYEAGVQDAIYRKEASVTGLDFGIISGSFVNHMIYASMNASKEKEQAAAALKQYNKEIAELEKSVTSTCEASEKEYIDTIYIPSVKLSFTALVYNWLDFYIKDLIDNGCFDRTALKYVDLERSNDLLKNLNLATNKSAILENAFLACPFNNAVYMKALTLDLLDYDSFQVAKLFNQSEIILDFLKNNWGIVAYPNKFNINYKYISVYSLFAECDSLDILHSLTNNYAIEIYNAYANVTKMLHDNKMCMNILKGYGYEAILHGGTLSKEVANRTIRTIVDTSVFEQLIEKCGHIDLLRKIKDLNSEYIGFNSKNELDVFLISRIDVCFESARKLLLPYANQKKEEKETQEKEKKLQRLKKEKAKKIRKIAIITSCCLILIGIILAISIPQLVENANISKREKLIAEKIQDITTSLEKQMEDATGIDITIDYDFSLENDWDTELWYEWGFCVRIPIFEDYRKSNAKNEQDLLIIMDACKILEEIYQDTLNDLRVTDFQYDGARIVIDYSGGGALAIRDLSTYETFYYEEYWGNRYLHSLKTEYVIIGGGNI